MVLFSRILYDPSRSRSARSICAHSRCTRTSPIPSSLFPLSFFLFPFPFLLLPSEGDSFIPAKGNVLLRQNRQVSTVQPVPTAYLRTKHMQQTLSLSTLLSYLAVLRVITYACLKWVGRSLPISSLACGFVPQGPRFEASKSTEESRTARLSTTKYSRRHGSPLH
ncbi:hypothetical protein GGR50DRAFT_620734 [Xylaria sp. CBS 124048]|nr:hypothetical protein GGR50DRAFT_620734 [Xylaria sp. CBS 124048]